VVDALLFALTIELFGHVSHHVEPHADTVIWAVFICAIIDSLVFSTLNAILNNRDTFMRRFSSVRSFLARIEHIRTELLIEKLSRIKVLNELTPELMAKLVCMRWN